jgi:hypothetical protein
LLLLPGSDTLSRLSMRNSTQVGVDRFEIPIRHVAINGPRHYSQSIFVNRIETGAHNALELF